MRRGHKAREGAQKLAERLKEKLDAKFHWDGDVLKFERTGASGKITVGDKDVRIEVDLGLMLRPMKSKVEEKIEQYLKEYMS